MCEIEKDFETCRGCDRECLLDEVNDVGCCQECQEGLPESPEDYNIIHCPEPTEDELPDFTEDRFEEDRDD